MASRRMPVPSLVVRRAVQLGVIGLVAYLGIRHQLVKGAGGAAPLDAFCPFGAVETLPSLFGGLGFVAKTGMSNLVLLGAVAVSTLLFSGAFCGWLCPFGGVQDLLAAVGRMVLKRDLRLPEAVHRYLKHLRWAVLALILWMSWRFVGLWFAEYDPYRALFHFRFETSLSVVLVVGTVIGGVLVERFWCLYACPLGALVGAVGLAGLAKVERSEGACVDCGLCASRCPMSIPVDAVRTVSDQHCTMCTECVEVCPKDGALAVTFASPSRRVAPLVMGVATVGVFFAVIAAGMAAGVWETPGGCAGCSGEMSVAPANPHDPVALELASLE